MFIVSKLALASGLKDLIVHRICVAADDDEKSCCFVEPYQNGREIGYTVFVRSSIRNSVTISECRNSDEIVVYHNNLAFQGLSEEAYKTAKFFDYNDYNGVVEHCVKFLRGEK